MLVSIFHTCMKCSSLQSCLILNYQNIKWRLNHANIACSCSYLSNISFFSAMHKDSFTLILKYNLTSSNLTTLKPKSRMTSQVGKLSATSQDNQGRTIPFTAMSLDISSILTAVCLAKMESQLLQYLVDSIKFSFTSTTPTQFLYFFNGVW